MSFPIATAVLIVACSLGLWSTLRMPRADLGPAQVSLIFTAMGTQPVLSLDVELLLLANGITVMIGAFRGQRKGVSRSDLYAVSIFAFVAYHLLSYRDIAELSWNMERLTALSFLTNGVCAGLCFRLAWFRAGPFGSAHFHYRQIPISTPTSGTHHELPIDASRKPTHAKADDH